jgi:IS5 family transposase
VRTKMMHQEYLDFEKESSPLKVVREWEEKYEGIDRVLRESPRVLELAHGDLSRLSQSRKGRSSKYTSEEILRALIVMFVEGDDYRGAVIRIEGSPYLREFVGIRDVKPMMDFTFLSRAVGVLGEKTVMAMNEALAREAVRSEKISGKKLRGDTTVVETNIHFPTDAWLLWDCYRVLARELKRVQKGVNGLKVRHRFHTKKVKRDYLFISRHSRSESKRRRREVKSRYRRLIQRVRWISMVCAEIREQLPSWSLEEPELARWEILTDSVIDQAERRVLHGLQVPCNEKVYSIFEEHTELIMRGKARKPLEFGHKVVLAQTEEKFISQYEVLRQNQTDQALVDPILASHRKTFGKDPESMSLDQGFYESPEQLAELRKTIKTVSIRKKGKLTEEERALQSHEEFKAGQRFRAGIEGSISVLKRAFKLARCLFKGFKNYAVGVGLAVLCYNLVLLTRL